MVSSRANAPHILAIGNIGDTVGQRMLTHKPVQEAPVAALVIVGQLQSNKELASAAFNARVVPNVPYAHPEVGWVGVTEDRQGAGHQSQKRPVPLDNVMPRDRQ